MSVGKFCVRTVDTAEANESVQVAASRMNARNVGMLVVINKQRQPIGIVTDRDLTIGVLAHARDPFQTCLEDVMTLAPTTVSEDTPIEDALSLMRSGPFRRLPVVDERDQLVGVLSVDDVLDLLAEEFGQVRKLLQKENPATIGRT